MSALVVDTSSWIAWLAGGGSSLVDEALEEGRLHLPVIVAAELLSGRLDASERAELQDMLSDLPAVGTDPEHWFRVGKLRAGLRARGVSDIRLEKLGLEYRYITRYLRGELGTFDDLCLQLGTAIRQFAKEQLTWFKRDQRIIWLDPFGDYLQEACARIHGW